MTYPLTHRRYLLVSGQKVFSERHGLDYNCIVIAVGFCFLIAKSSFVFLQLPEHVSYLRVCFQGTVLLMMSGLAKLGHYICENYFQLLPPFQPLPFQAFTASSILRTHIRQHSGEKPFKCKHCGKAFASHAAHDSHVRRTHSKEKGCTCSVCNQHFLEQEDYHFHMKTHAAH